jgi:drug/metabolite transporter (DMT)-like permease
MANVLLTRKYKQSGNAFPIAALLGGATIWGLLWYPYRLLEQAGFSGSVATAVTYLVALMLGLAVFRNSLRDLGMLGGRLHLLLWIGLCAGWTNLAYVLGVIHGEVVRVLLLFYLAPLWTIAFARMLLNEKLSLHGYLVIALSLSGAIVMLWQPQTGFLLPLSYGDWMGLSAGIMFALSNVLSRRDQFHNVQLKSLAVWTGVTVVALGYTFFGEAAMPRLISTESFLLLLGLGIVVFGLSVMVQYGLNHVSANRAIVIMLFELVVAAVAAYFLTDEELTMKEWVGGAMIISASLFSTKMNR